MAKRCLIVYQSLTGNTEKVAHRIKDTFERNKWQCDIFKIDKTCILKPPFGFKDYDFVCVGSGIFAHSPYDEILGLIRRQFFGITQKLVDLAGVDKESLPPELKPRPIGEGVTHKKIVLDKNKYAIVFITYAGYEFGPREAIPAMELLALEIEHLGFKCLGQFCCPGRFINKPMLHTYHGDIRHRPNEDDLKKAEMFIEEKLEKIADRNS